MDKGWWWIIPCIVAEMAFAAILVYFRYFRGRDIHFDVHPLQVVGTIYDAPPRKYVRLANGLEELNVEDVQERREDEDHEHHIPRGRKLLTLFRVTVLAWSVFIIIDEAVDKGNKYYLTLRYFTTWNYLLQCVHWLVLSFCCLLHLCHYAVPERMLQAANILHSTTFPMSILVSLVFWGALVPQDLENHEDDRIHADFDMYSFSQHAINTCLLLLDFCFNRYLVHDHHFLFMMFWLFAYCVFAWINHACTGFWAYFFMEIKPIAMLWYSGVLLILFVVFQLTHLISKFKKSFVGEVDVMYSCLTLQDPLLE